MSDCCKFYSSHAVFKSAKQTVRASIQSCFDDNIKQVHRRGGIWPWINTHKVQNFDFLGFPPSPVPISTEAKLILATVVRSKSRRKLLKESLVQVKSSIRSSSKASHLE